MPEGGLALPRPTSPFVVIITGADDLGNLVELFTDIRQYLGLEFPLPRLADDMRAVGIRDKTVIPAVDPGTRPCPRIRSTARPPHRLAPSFARGASDPWS